MQLSDTTIMAATVLVFGIAFTMFMMWFLDVVTRVPNEEREYLDKPEGLFLILWLPIRLVAFYISPFINKDKVDKLNKQLKMSGMDYVLLPHHVVSSQLIFAFFFGSLSWFLLSMIDYSWTYALFGFLFGFIYPNMYLNDKVKKRTNTFLKELPFFLDMITLCVESGLNFNGALQQAVLKGPKGVVRNELARVLREIKAGKVRVDALRQIATRVDDTSVRNLVASIVQAENMGMSLGPILRIQSDQRRTERFLRAEKIAMEAPVKMLFPLVAFIFPCTFVVIGFPVYAMMKGILD